MTNTLRILVNGKPYLVTFSRTLSPDEQRRISAMTFAGTVSTLEDVTKVVRGALTMLNVQNEAMLAALAVREAEDAPR